jgi:hypothetical protein
MPKRVKIDSETYEIHLSPTGKRFVAKVSDPDDAGTLLPTGMIWWFDPDSHLSQREQVDQMLLDGRLEWLEPQA